MEDENRFAAISRKERNFWYRQNSDQSSATLSEPMNQVQKEKLQKNI